MPQNLCHDIFHHPLRHRRIDHAGQRLGQGLVADDSLHPGPKAEDRLAVCERREILKRAAWSIDDIARFFRRMATAQIDRKPRFRESGIERGFVGAPVGV
jgi:hypothetical protein